MTTDYHNLKRAFLWSVITQLKSHTTIKENALAGDRNKDQRPTKRSTRRKIQEI